MKNHVGSVAPRERVNITYRPASEGAQEDIELPFKILVLGDFTGRPDERPVEERPPISIDKDNFDKVMAAQQLAVDISIPDNLVDAPADDHADGELAVSLRFHSLADFRPEGLAQQVPELRRLLELRAALVALKGPIANVPGFVRKIRELLKDPEQRERLLRELELEDSPT
jgi:type VI secretion system protein ImpB